VILDEVESQLSAMLDGELPAAECELLSRRIDRDENLRARWSRYALIGAAMRLEPVATARRNFAARVSSALELAEGKAGSAAATGAYPRRLWWQAALAAGLVGAVAGLSITMLRSVTQGTTGGAAQSVSNLPGAQSVGPVLSLPVAPPHGALAATRVARAHTAATATVAAGAASTGAPAIAADSDREPWSYITPRDDGGAKSPLRTDLVDYIVAHSEYSTPLMLPDLLSELISGEDGLDSAASVAGADNTHSGAGAPVNAGADGVDATAIPASASGR
jgi:negative regulator of sigma E activity